MLRGSFSSVLAYSGRSPPEAWRRLSLASTSIHTQFILAKMVPKAQVLKRLELAWLKLLGFIIRLRKADDSFGLATKLTYPLKRLYGKNQESQWVRLEFTRNCRQFDKKQWIRFH